MNDTPQERALLAKMPEDQTYLDALAKLSGVHSKSAIAVLLIEERKAGCNEMLESLAVDSEFWWKHWRAEAARASHLDRRESHASHAEKHRLDAARYRSMKKP